MPVRMTAAAAAVLALLACQEAGVGAAEPGELVEVEPPKMTVPGSARSYHSGSNHYDVLYEALPHKMSDDIVAECERLGFNQIEDSIDSSYGDARPSQDIYVWDEGVLAAPTLWDMLQPYLPRLAEFVTARKRLADPDAETALLGWAFIRKYSSSEGSTRNSLRVHQDSNTHSLNIQLNPMEGFAGGGLFVVDAIAARARYSIDDLQYKHDQFGREEHNMPHLFDTDEWLNGVQRVNNSELHFPWFGHGTGVLHNNTVWHGIAPVKSGTRYSLLMFYDTGKSGPGTGNAPDPSAREIKIENPSGADVECFWVSMGEPGSSVGVVEAGDVRTEHSYVGHKFVCKDSASGAVKLRLVVGEEEGTQEFAVGGHGEL